MSILKDYILRSPTPTPKKPPSINPELKQLLTTWKNWILEKNKICTKSFEQLKTYLCFNPDYTSKTKPTSEYNIVIADPQAKNVPVINVVEWHKDGHLQAVDVTVMNTFQFKHVNPIELATVLNTENPGAYYLLTGQLFPLLDGSGMEFHLGIFQWGDMIGTPIPYFLCIFAIILQLVVTFYNIQSIHDIIPKYKEFINLKLNKEFLYDLIQNSMERYPEGPLAVYIRGSTGSEEEVIESLIHFHIPLGINITKIYPHIIEGLITTIFS